MKAWQALLIHGTRLRKRLFDRLATYALLLSVLFLLTACGSSVPPKVVKQALDYQLHQGQGERSHLVGYATLQAQTKLVSVSVQDHEKVNLPIDGSQQETHQLTGTYTLRVKPVVGGSSYRRTREPFELLLAQVGEKPKTWQLIQPTRPDSLEQWTRIDF